MRKLVVATVLGLALSGASVASADLPPPDGQKFVNYAFKVEGLGKYADYVLLAYPYSLSNGAPTTEHAKLEDGKETGLGRRSAQPKLYAMNKRAYEEWLESYEPTHSMDDPALTALFTSDKVIPCDAKLTPSYQLATTDPRSAIVEAFRIEALGEKSCKLALVGAPPTRVASGESPTQQPPKKAGCAGCATPSNEGSGAGALALLLALALSGTWRRSARRTSLR
jgi:hypothetical protein